MHYARPRAPPLITCLLAMQTKSAFEAASGALKGAGVELVEIDMGLLEHLADDMTPGMMFFTYEMPREISR